MIGETILVADVALNTTKPTPFSFTDLGKWVIWQFPKLHGEQMIGAVHPPIAGHGWYPAAIDYEAETLDVFAHTGEPQATPEKAAAHFSA